MKIVAKNFPLDFNKSSARSLSFPAGGRVFYLQMEETRRSALFSHSLCGWRYPFQGLTPRPAVRSSSCGLPEDTSSSSSFETTSSSSESLESTLDRSSVCQLASRLPGIHPGPLPLSVPPLSFQTASLFSSGSCRLERLDRSLMLELFASIDTRHFDPRADGENSRFVRFLGPLR